MTSSPLVLTIAIASFLVIFARVIDFIGSNDHRRWKGNTIRFIAISASMAAVGAGALAAVAGQYQFAAESLLFGVAGFALFDRRGWGS